MKYLKTFFAFFSLLIVAGFAFSQDRTGEKDKKADQKSIEVEVNVAVKDAAGNFVGDIKIEDLKIFEDGVEQKITRFEKKEPVANVGLVVDNTGSMRLHLDSLIETNSQIVKNLGEKDEAFIVRFVSTDKTTIWQDWTADKSQLTKAIDAMFIEGGQSSILDGLNLASMKIFKRAEKDNAKKYSLILISDCEDRESVSILSGFLDTIQKSDVQMFVIAFTGELNNRRDIFTKKIVNSKDNAERLANLLALRTGGRAFFIEKPNDEKIRETVKNLIAEIHAPYVVGYTSMNQKYDGKLRKLTIQIADGVQGGKRQGFIRESFIVPKD